MPQTTLIQKQFNGIEFSLIPHNEHEFALTSSEVAKGYGISDITIRRHLQSYASELTEGKHYFKGVQNMNTLKNQQPHQTFWTKRGIIRLGFFIKSERARKFRDWIEDLIIETTQTPIADTLLSEPATNLSLGDVDIRTINISSLDNHIKAQGFTYNDDFFIFQRDAASVASQTTQALTQKLRRNPHDFIEGKDYIRLRHSYWWSKRCLKKLGYIISIEEHETALNPFRTPYLEEIDVSQVNYTNIAISSPRGKFDVQGIAYMTALFAPQHDLTSALELTDDAFYKMRSRRKGTFKHGADYLRCMNKTWWSNAGLAKLGYYVKILGETEHAPVIYRPEMRPRIRPLSHTHGGYLMIEQAQGDYMCNEQLICDAATTIIKEYCERGNGTRQVTMSGGTVYLLDDIVAKLARKLPEKVFELSLVKAER